MPSLTIRLDQETDSLLRQHQTRQQLVASIHCGSKETVMLRIAESEASSHLSDEDYEKSMKAFFAKELGLIL